VQNPIIPQNALEKCTGNGVGDFAAAGGEGVTGGLHSTALDEGDKPEGDEAVEGGLPARAVGAGGDGDAFRETQSRNKTFSGVFLQSESAIY